MDSSQRGLRSECRTDIEIMPEACGQPIRIIGMGTGRPLFLPGVSLYSRTWMFFFAQMSFRILGQTLTDTSPRCALRSKSMRVRDWPMPVLGGIWIFRMA